MSTIDSLYCTLIHNVRNNDEGIPTVTSREQDRVEENVSAIYSEFISDMDIEPIPILMREKHKRFLIKGIQHLNSCFECLDSSRPWLCYWIIHSLQLLGETPPATLIADVSAFLGQCQSPHGGFGGGPEQLPHLACTYAAVNVLCLLGTQTAYDVIDRPKLQEFMHRCHQGDGSFIMHEGGEVDIRGAYCAASVAGLTNLYTESLFDNTGEWLSRCQTYEGGFAGMPGLEAHGGYTFCGLAALILLDRPSLCDVDRLLSWVAHRQCKHEGGFQGRTNKLVDGCYSFWQGACFPLIYQILSNNNDPAVDSNAWLFHQGALQEYILICCQHYGGGLIDKPGKYRDYYHTCYCLSGLSVAQNSKSKASLGNESVECFNDIGKVHPLHNINPEAAYKAMKYFNQQEIPKVSTFL